jgi:hypothetical protein
MSLHLKETWTRVVKTEDVVAYNEEERSPSGNESSVLQAGTEDGAKKMARVKHSYCIWTEIQIRAKEANISRSSPGIQMQH